MVYEFEYRDLLTSRNILLGIRVDNVGDSPIHVNPNYCTITDLNGATYNYSEATYSMFSNPLEAIAVQPGNHTFGGLVFFLPKDTGPRTFVYQDLSVTIKIDLTKPLR